MKKLLVTSYANPDIDRTACSIAYAEYLKKTGQDAVYGVFGVPQREPQFVYNYLQIQPVQAEQYLKDYTNIIIVDGSDVRWLPKEITIENVVEVIDHRAVNDADKFTNAKIQIELVGSAATLIAEKFMTTSIPITHESTIFLCAAIVSNTINFKANVTTDRDKKAADWLKSQTIIPEDFVKQMFDYKSQLLEPLDQIIVKEFTWIEAGNKKVGIAQLEVTKVAELLQNRKQEIINILSNLQHDKKLDYIFLTAIDIEKGTNTFLAFDSQSQKLVQQALNIKFDTDTVTREGVMMRKTITPLLKEVLENAK